MKKLVAFCLIPFILLFCVIVFSLLLPTQVNFAFETVKGDSAYEKKIAFDLTNDTSTIDFSNYKSYRNGIQISKERNKIVYRIDYFKDRKKIDAENSLTFDISSNIQLSNSFEEKSIDDDQYPSECKIIENRLESYPLIYDLNFMRDEYGYMLSPFQYIGGNQVSKPITLQTDLKFMNTDKVTLLNIKQICGDGYEEESIDRRNSDPTDTSFLRSISVENYKGNYYFMPSTDETITGQNKIYKVSLVKDTEREQEIYYQNDVKTLIDLPTNRYYLTMKQDQENLYIISYDAENYYLMNYRINGKFIKEIVLDKTSDKNHATMDMKNGYLMILQSTEKEGNYYIYNANDLSLEKKIAVRDLYENAILYMMDVMYKDGELYILYSKESDYMKLEEVLVLVLDENSVLYKGKMNVGVSGYDYYIGQWKEVNEL